MRDTEWMADGLCASYDLTGGIDPWFPSSTGNGARQEARAGIEICRGCPVRVQCLTYARQLRIPMGVFGGVLRNQRAPALPPPALCGTDAGYTQHRRRKENPCRACVRAHTLAYNERKARRRA